MSRAQLKKVKNLKTSGEQSLASSHGYRLSTPLAFSGKGNTLRLKKIKGVYLVMETNKKAGLKAPRVRELWEQTPAPRSFLKQQGRQECLFDTSNKVSKLNK